jgi:hypothetical protein
MSAEKKELSEKKRICLGFSCIIKTIKELRYAAP